MRSSVLVSGGARSAGAVPEDPYCKGMVPSDAGSRIPPPLFLIASVAQWTRAPGFEPGCASSILAGGLSAVRTAFCRGFLPVKLSSAEQAPCKREGVGSIPTTGFWTTIGPWRRNRSSVQEHGSASSSRRSEDEAECGTLRR